MRVSLDSDNQSVVECAHLICFWKRAFLMNKKTIYFSVLAAFSGFALSANAATIRMTCRSKGMELELCKKAAEEWKKKHNNAHKVEIITLPHASNECFALYQQLLSAETFDVDIFQMDGAWIGVFSEHLASLSKIYGNNEGNSGKNAIDLNDYFDAVKENMYSEGEIVALPWYTDCGIMYYRKDLLEKYNRPVPQTWEELFETAKYIQDREREDEGKHNRFYGFVFQAKAFEMLTCNFVQFLDSFGGSVIKNGKANVDSEEGTDTIKFFVNCLKNISSKSILNYSEEDARGAFQSGNAVFMSNWPYAWSLMNHPGTAVNGKIGVMQIPPRNKTKGKSSGVLGGWFLTVSKYSKKQELAADLIKFLTDKRQQKLRAQYSYLPAFKSLYKDKDVLKQNPFFEHVYHSLENAVVRPSSVFGKNYSRASTEIFNIVNTILADAIERDDYSEKEIKKNLNRLNRRLNKILNKSNKDANKKDEADTKPGFFTEFFSKMKETFKEPKNK